MAAPESAAPSFTLDTNCILDLANNRPRASFLQPLVVAWRTGRIDLAVVAISASENQLGGVPNREYSAFEALLGQSGLRGVKELLPPLIWDLGYWDHMTFMEEEQIPQLMRLSRTLFPNSALPPVEGQLNSKWRNQQCDILVAWTHAQYKRDYLVTSDRNFLQRAIELRTVGIHEVIDPQIAAGIARDL